jgi:hypothetical protein
VADITPSRIEPLGDTPEHNQENPGRTPVARPKVSEKPALVLPPLEVDPDPDEIHQLDELA